MKDIERERIYLWRQQNPKLVSRYNRITKLNRLGITEQEFSELFAKQNGKCAVEECGCDIKHIDHDHKTGKIRGLLCIRCNTGIGLFDDNPSKLIAAARYIESRQQMVLMGGVRLPRRPMSEEARRKSSERAKGNKWRVGNPGRPGPRSEKEKEAVSIKGKERWAKMSDTEKETYRQNGRNNAQKRWEVAPSGTQV